VGVVGTGVRPLALALTEGHGNERPQMPGRAERETDDDGEQPDLGGIAVETEAGNTDGKDVDDEQTNVSNKQACVLNGVGVLQGGTEALFVNLSLRLVVSGLGLQEISVPVPHGKISPDVVLQHEGLDANTASMPRGDVCTSEGEESLFSTPQIVRFKPKCGSASSILMRALSSEQHVVNDSG